MCPPHVLYNIKVVCSKDDLREILELDKPTQPGFSPLPPVDNSAGAGLAPGASSAARVIGLLFKRVCFDCAKTSNCKNSPNCSKRCKQKLLVGSLLYNGGKYEEKFPDPQPPVPSPWSEHILLTEKITDDEKINYHNAHDFDLAFFPKNVIEDMLLIAQSMDNNYSDSKPSLLFQRGLVGPQQLFYEGTPANKFYFPRKYCTMTVKPHPDPVPPLKFDGSPDSYTDPVEMNESLAIYYAPPCPPIWWIGGGGSLLAISTTGVPFSPMAVLSEQYTGIAPAVYRLTRWESLLWGLRNAFLRRPGGGRRSERPQNPDYQRPESPLPEGSIGKGS